MQIIAAHAGTGKSTFASMYPDKVLDLVSLPYKYDLKDIDATSEAVKANPDLTLHYEWPHNYVAEIKRLHKRMEPKIVLIPSDSLVLDLLKIDGIECTLCYPVREAKEVYKQRYIDRGNTEEFLDIFIGRWDVFIDILEGVCCKKRIILQPHEYLSDRLSDVQI